MGQILDVAIIGAGFGGLGAAIQIKKNTRRTFSIFERSDSIGGTWRDNIYPGCACDVPSHVYSFSFDQNPNWSRKYSEQKEILDYIVSLKEKHQLEQYISYNCNITELNYKASNKIWQLTDQNGKMYYARTVVAAIGPLNVPNIPSLNGFEHYEGFHFHSSAWPKGLDLSQKNVAIIGTGASAIQIVPKIAPEVNQLYVFQRTAPWILPKNDRSIHPFFSWLFHKLPYTQKINRALLYWYYEWLGKALFGNKQLQKITQKVALRHLEKSVQDPVLRAKLTPDYEIGCKRRLPSDDYYPALLKPHVELITEPVANFSKSAIVDDNGKSRNIDVLIWATGFQVADFEERKLKVRGINGADLFDFWQRNGPEAHWGTCISGFPGLLFVLGPNTGLGHNSQLHIMESQFNYIIDYINYLFSMPDHVALDVKVEVQDRYNKHIQEQLKGMVWSSGCKSWYLHASGKNSTIWPGHTYTYRKLTRKIKASDFNVI